MVTPEYQEKERQGIHCDAYGDLAHSGAEPAWGQAVPGTLSLERLCPVAP